MVLLKLRSGALTCVTLSHPLYPIQKILSGVMVGLDGSASSLLLLTCLSKYPGEGHPEAIRHGTQL